MRLSKLLTMLLAAGTTVTTTAVVGVAMAGDTSWTTSQARAIAQERAKAYARANAKEAGLAPGTFKGQAFDACTAPSTEQMKAWRASPYKAAIIYFGGVARGCKQPNLTASWVSAQRAAGWKLIPIYVGPQAPCTKSKSKYKISLSTPGIDGQAAATDAATQARNLGLKLDSVLIYDMESYAGDAACEKAVLDFLSAWTIKLHDLNYLSGVYGDMSAAITDVVAAHDDPGFVPPDYVDFARWDNVATLTDVAIPDTHWAGQRRMKQYRGPHKETWGGVTINIDSNLVDLAPAPETRTGDFTGNGWSDLLTISAGGVLDLRIGNGKTFTTRRLGAGWGAMDSIIRADFNADRKDDVIARETATGRLWLYPGTGIGVSSRINIGKGWGGLREITPAGDMNLDGKADLLAVETSTGRLMLYPGKGTGLGSGTQVGMRDWNQLEELAGVGDVDGDGVGDLVARAKATGMLRLYGGWGRTMNTFREVLPGGAGLSSLAGAGDFDRDGTNDLMAVDTATGTLYRYPVRPGGLGERVRVAEDMAGARLL